MATTDAERRDRAGFNWCRVHWLLLQARYRLTHGRYPAALLSAQRARRLLGPPPNRPPMTARIQVLGILALIHETLADHASTELLLHELYTVLTHPADPTRAGEIVDTLTRLGNLARLRGDYQQAEQHLQRALRIAAAFPRRTLNQKIAATNVLAITFKDTGRYPEASALYHQVLTDWTAMFGRSSPAVASVHHNLAGLAHAQGHYQQAEPSARLAVHHRTRRHGTRHPAVAADLAVLAAVLLGQHKLREAQNTYRQAVAIYTRVLGPQHYEVAVVLNGLATIEIERGQPADAEPLYHRALAIKTRVLGPEHPEIGVLLNNLAVAQRQTGHLAAAAANYQRAIPLLERSLGPQHPTVTTAHHNLATLTAHTPGISQ